MSQRLTRLVDLIGRLRDPEGGCPWDRAQDHRTLRPYVVEEAYEVVAAIDSDDPHELKSELGDLLLQVLLHSRIAEEAGEFTLDDVMEGLAEKLERRHPHVFGDAPSDLSSIRTRWDAIKASEPRRQKAELPPLLAARKLVSSLPEGASVEDLLDPVDDEERAGLELLAAVARAWESGVDPEIALRKVVDAVRVRSGDPHGR
ncbi:MAG: MazG family protein [Thermotogota bacterium]